MQVIDTIDELVNYRNALSGVVGVVPTMGHLHQGHLTLIEQSQRHCDVTVLTIFVNPAQFNNPQDLEHYPRTLAKDLEMAELQGVDIVFTPNADMMYPDGYTYQLHEQSLSNDMEGASRPGHFAGVLTIVLKLFNLIKADKAFFGEKDYQQLQLVQGMAKALFLQTEVIGCPIVREPSGLAMSSRNSRLSAPERILASKLYEAMRTSATTDEAKTKLTELGFKVDYIIDKGGRRFAAAFLGQVRLIDNIPLSDLTL